jgi:multicomponent Na+:H+ antiporter subunit B
MKADQKDEVEGLHESESVHRPALGLVLVGGVAALMAAAAIVLPREHSALSAVARYSMDIALPKWKITEPVNEIVYGSRGFDTFGETFLLLAAVFGIGMITRPREARHGFIGEAVAGKHEQAEFDPAGGSSETTETPEESEGRMAEREELIGADQVPMPDFLPLGRVGVERSRAMSPVVRTAVRVVSPVLLTAGIYLAAWGYSPGGGFPAGAVVLGVVLLAYVSLGYKAIERFVRPGLVEPLEIAGAILIVLCEVLGLVFRGSFSANFLPLAQAGTPLSGGILQWFSGSELIEVGTGLTLAVFGLLGMQHDWSPDEDAGEEALHGPAERPGAGEETAPG